MTALPPSSQPGPDPATLPIATDLDERERTKRPALFRGIMLSGAGGATPSFSESTRRAARASARLSAISFSSEPAIAIIVLAAKGAVSHEVGSSVPGQSNSSR